jgi:hypothetical protein
MVNCPTNSPLMAEGLVMLKFTDRVPLIGIEAWVPNPFGVQRGLSPEYSTFTLMVDVPSFWIVMVVLKLDVAPFQVQMSVWLESCVIMVVPYFAMKLPVGTCGF